MHTPHEIFYLKGKKKEKKEKQEKEKDEKVFLNLVKS